MSDNNILSTPVPESLVGFLSQSWISESQPEQTPQTIVTTTESTTESSVPATESTTESSVPATESTTESSVPATESTTVGEITSVVDDNPNDISKEDMELIEQLSNEAAFEGYGFGGSGSGITDAAMQQNINFLMELFFIADTLMLPVSFINSEEEKTSFVGSCVATKIFTFFVQFREHFEKIDNIETFYHQIYQAGCSDYKRLCDGTNRRLAFEEALRYRRTEAIVYVTNQLVTNTVNQNNLKKILNAVKIDNTAVIINRDNTTFVAIYRPTVLNTWIIVDPTCPYIGVLNDDALFSLITMDSLWDYGITILTTKTENVQTIIPSVRIVSPSNPDGNLRILPGEPYDQIAM